MIGVYDSNLKGPYKEILLTIVDLDEDNCCFIIAYVVVDQESKNNWCHFLDNLRGVISDDLEGQCTFIANRCKVKTHKLC